MQYTFYTPLNMVTLTEMSKAIALWEATVTGNIGDGAIMHKCDAQNNSANQDVVKSAEHSK